jgi:hypothetical protein
MFEGLRAKLAEIRARKRTGNSKEIVVSPIIDEDKDRVDDRFEEVIAAAGYSYDHKQDIFYSNMNAWQRDMGYCRLYDEAAALLGMIVDCEPVYFDYEGKRWLIEFWKGQYDMPTGGEIGIYTTKGPDIDIPGIFEGPFFHCASNEDHLEMSFTLYKNGQKLFTRQDKHWWLTGFKLGEFSEPYELTMDISITLKNEEMRDVFVKALRNMGYSEKKIKIKGNSVNLMFDSPYSTQPSTRSPETEWIIQWKNKLLCDRYHKVTGPYDNFADRMLVLREKEPKLYEQVINIVKTKQFFGKLEKVIDYIT